MSSSNVQRFAIVGVGSRASFYYSAITKQFTKTAKLVGLCDLNQTRMDYANKALGEYGHPPVPTYKENEFDKMVQEQTPDYVIVTTMDKFHHKYCVRAMELGANAIVEKPMTIDAEKLQAMIDGVKNTGKEIRVTFNYRYAPHNTKVRELIADDVIGEVTQVHFEWLLDTHHGGDFFRRWHRMKENSGGLLLSKSIHHFDLVTFWLGSDPELVYALGGLRFYGRENAKKRGVDTSIDRYHGNEDKAKDDPFYLSLADNPQLKAMYLDAEKEDGYKRDQYVFGDGITMEDTLGLMARFENNAILTYSTNAYSPYEGFRVNFTGTKGRIELVVIEAKYVPGEERQTYGVGASNGDNSGSKYVHGGILSKSITVMPMFGSPYDVPIPKASGGHGGGDPLLLSDILEGRKPDRFNRAAFIREGAMSTLIGIGGNKSIETGLPVKVQELVHF
ncbi:hypothetical protein F5884DRAFT_781074 [Xylogone sp. PMI_703]|nr:hypothetical protein F5884DRAFT_781074 [Xylogone sp. PMI_703]